MTENAIHQNHGDSAPTAAFIGEVKRRSPLAEAFAVVALSLGTFAFVSTELMPIGILPRMADGVGVSLGQAGFLVTGFALLVAIAATPLTAATRRWNRKWLMLSLLLACTLGNVLTCFAQTYAVLLASRLIVAAAIGIFWSTAASMAVRIVPGRHAVRATSAVYGGLAFASVLGIPAGTFLGNYAGWRIVFVGLAVLSLAVFIKMWLTLPDLAATQEGNHSTVAQAWQEPPLRAAVYVTALIMTANFLAFTYIAPFLEQITGFETAWIGGLLLAYGAAGLVGNFGIGPIMARGYRPTLFVTMIVLIASIAALSFAGTNRGLVIALLLVWGAAYTALPVLMQTWVFKAAAHLNGPEAPSSLYVSAYNGAIAAGAFVGGVIVDHAGPWSIMPISAVIGIPALLIALKHAPK
ncbi:MFS transporter [Azospirillum picis]|uniref:MFS family arabinose efflux permease n=1 Tax=Azospirillum picis TaxID=488438 RepID=A0ABU0MVC1_9PROT|nr:MFS transporter [Azospirillum picis]MBP2303605.1 putative MFS family arabinose efflux permease [Azospirillum picis]MDQ0537446.1 putative MFS family arabinose efflux permease [Azospirillum picis]